MAHPLQWGAREMTTPLRERERGREREREREREGKGERGEKRGRE